MGKIAKLETDTMDMEREPNSVGHWRRNSIMAFQEMARCCAEPVADPEELERRCQNAKELADLKARETNVQQRYARMLARKGQHD